MGFLSLDQHTGCRVKAADHTEPHIKNQLDGNLLVPPAAATVKSVIIKKRFTQPFRDLFFEKKLLLKQPQKKQPHLYKDKR